MSITRCSDCHEIISGVVYCEECYAKLFGENERHKLQIEKMQNNLNKIAAYYGNKQFMQTVEELSELTKAICKYQRFSSLPTFENEIIEEIADVEIMTAQLKLLLKAESDVEEIKKAKIQRQLDRIEQEQECENNATCNNSNAI